MNTSGDNRALAAFQSLLDDFAQPSPDNTIPMTDRLVGAAAGPLLRRCAVPHDFDRALLQRLGACSEHEADERYVQFAGLSIIQLDDENLSVHERWRQPIWRWWLDTPQRSEFVALNEVLVEWFAAPANSTGEDPAARRRMFHLFGCRQAEGVQVFEELFRVARWRRRFSECALLLRLAHEYDPVLLPRERALLRYNEGKLASDLLDWEHSLTLLRAVAADVEADSVLRINAQVRAGHALRMSGRKPEALALLKDARNRVAAEPTAARSGWRVLYELGEVYRDLGHVDDAREALLAALAQTNDDGEDYDRGGLLNSLGTVYRNLREIDSAIAAFRGSLDDLKQRGDAIRIGTVLNNLGLALVERCDWKAAEVTLAESLGSKRAAGDLLGQAKTLVNLSQVWAAQGRWEHACRSAEEAASCYEVIGDAHGRAQARLRLAKFLRCGKRRDESVALLRAVIADANAIGDTNTAAKASAELCLNAQRRGLTPWRLMLIMAGGLILLVILLK